MHLEVDQRHDDVRAPYLEWQTVILPTYTSATWTATTEDTTQDIDLYDTASTPFSTSESLPPRGRSSSSHRSTQQPGSTTGPDQNNHMGSGFNKALGNAAPERTKHYPSVLLEEANNA